MPIILLSLVLGQLPASAVTRASDTQALEIEAASPWCLSAAEAQAEAEMLVVNQLTQMVFSPDHFEDPESRRQLALVFRNPQVQLQAQVEKRQRPYATLYRTDLHVRVPAAVVAELRSTERAAATRRWWYRVGVSAGSILGFGLLYAVTLRIDARTRGDQRKILVLILFLGAVATAAAVFFTVTPFSII